MYVCLSVCMSSLRNVGEPEVVSRLLLQQFSTPVIYDPFYTYRWVIPRSHGIYPSYNSLATTCYTVTFNLEMKTTKIVLNYMTIRAR